MLGNVRVTNKGNEKTLEDSDHLLGQAEKALNAKIGFAVSPSQVKNCLLGSFRECVLLISRTRDTARRHVVHRNKMSLQILHAYQTAAAAGV